MTTEQTAGTDLHIDVWEHQPEGEEGGTSGVRCESIRICPAREGWVEVATTGSAFLSPERAREAAAAILASIGDDVDELTAPDYREASVS